MRVRRCGRPVLARITRREHLGELPEGLQLARTLIARELGMVPLVEAKQALHLRQHAHALLAL